MFLPILLRVSYTFGVLLLLTRVAGKKELSQTTFFDFVTAIAIGDIAAEKLANPEEPLLPWTAAAVLWFALIILLDMVVVGNRKAAKLIEGEPTILMENGRILEQNLKANYLSVDELMAHLRKKGYFNPAEVEYAIFETDGSVTVQSKSQHRPLTPKDVNLPTSYEGIAREVVAEGQILHRNLMEMHLDAAWLRAELLKQGYPSEKQIFWAALDASGKLYVDAYVDPIAGRRLEIQDYGPH